jgi:hypothetical protein
MEGGTSKNSKRNKVSSVTHTLESINRGISQKSERKLASEDHSLPEECRLRVNEVSKRNR